VTQATADELRDVVIEELAKIAEIEPAQLTADASLEELDIDSLDLVELGQVIEERYGIQLEREDMKDVRTVGKAISVIVARAG
jgi:acyl carrier protein